MTSLPTPSDFVAQSEEIARRFLQTVVVIDDRAYESLQALAKPSAPLASPVRPSFNKSREESADTTDESSKEIARAVGLVGETDIEQGTTGQEASADTAHELDAKRLIEQFANTGITCAVLRPSEFEMEQFEKKVYALAERADVLVFDWVWFKDIEGKKVSELIVEITKRASQQHRLRLILIYTGQKRLEPVMNDVASALKKSGVTKTSRIDDFTIQTGGTRITIYGKGNVEPNDDTLRARMSHFDQLPNTVVTEFAKITSGLIRNVVLDAFADLRLNTHRILAKFDPDLDAAYLTHRALSEPPEDAELHLIPLILSEIQAVLEETDVSGRIGLKNIERWLTLQIERGLELKKRVKMISETAAKKAMLEIIEKGVRDKKLATSYPEMKDLLDRLREEDDKKALNKFTDLFTKDGSSGEVHDQRLALLMSVRSRYGSPPPTLTLGTIIAEDLESIDSEYWVCIQPVCDGVRLKKGREFPFLRLIKPQKNEGFGFLVRDNDKVVKLSLSLRAFESRLIPFTPKVGDKEIRASKLGENWHFSSSGTQSKEYRWVADLKTEHAQRVANDYATQLSRVGLTESEWLRRWARK